MPPGKKKEVDEYIAEVSVISPNLDLSKVKELFENGNTLVSVRCILHNFIFLYSMCELRRGRTKCKECEILKKRKAFADTKEIFEAKSMAAFPDIQYDMSLVIYVNQRTEVILICPVHGQFRITPEDHLNSVCGCPKCGHEKAGRERVTPFEELLPIFREKHGRKFKYIKETYIDQNHYMVMICPEHGEFEQFPISHKKGFGCWKCGITTRSRAKRMQLIDFKKLGKAIHGDLYDYDHLTRLRTTKDNVLIHCTKCNRKFPQSPGAHIYGCQGCPRCAGSKGEKMIIRVLEQYDIKYILQYKFEECKDIRCLPFDVYLPQYKICIEYDGIQHYITVPLFGGENGLRETQRRDAIKTKFCEDNNIDLIRIKYTDYSNIEDILIDMLCLEG
jgi:very-short-patch-repair endonuclease